MLKKPKKPVIAGKILLQRQDKRLAKSFSPAPFVDLVGKYLKKPITLENLLEFRMDLRNRSGFNSNNPRAESTKKVFLANVLLGKKDSFFLLKILKLDSPDNFRLFIGQEIQRICRQRKIPPTEAIKLFSDYVTLLNEKIITNSKKRVIEKCWSLNGTESEQERMSILRHDFILPVLFSIQTKPEIFLNEIKKYKIN